MRRDQFLKSLAALAAAGALPLTGQAASGMKIMIPANPGGGWDSTGRALGKARPAPSAWRSSPAPARATRMRSW